MTVRLLKPYAQRPVGAIATFDASTEAGMIEAKQASADLTGGFEYFLPRPGLKLQVAQIAVGSVSLRAAEQAPAILPEGQVLYVSGGMGTVGKLHRLDPAGGNTPLQSWAIGAGALAQIGPYAGEQRFLVTCSAGRVDASARDAGLSAVQTGMLTNGLSIMGDSYAANNWSPVNATYLAVQTSGIIATADEMLGGAFDINQMVAVGGKTAAQAFVEQLPSVLAKRNKFVYLSMGYNDMYVEGVTGDIAATRVIANIQAIIDNGQTPVWHTVGARNNQGAVKLADHLLCNALLRDFAKVNPCGVFLDLFAITADPATSGPTGVAVRAGWTLDGTNHWNLIAAYYAAKALAIRLRPLVTTPNQLPVGGEDRTTLLAYNVLNNVAFAGTAGTPGANVTGPIPTGWRVEWATRTGAGTAAVSVVDVLDNETGLPQAKGLRITISGTTAPGDAVIAYQTVTDAVTAGQLFDGAARVDILNPASVNRVAISVQANANERTWSGQNVAASGSGTNPDYPESVSLVKRTRKMSALVTGALTSFEMRIAISGTAGAGSYTLSQPRVRKY